MSVAAAELVEQVRGAGPQLEAAGRQAEIDRALPPEVVDLLRELGLFWLKTPEELGGRPLDPVGFCDVLEEVAYHDASAGWAVMVGNGTTGYLAGALPDEGVREVFPPGGPLPIMAGQFVPRGTGTRADGGYRITGRWSFASGITHADWVTGGFHVEDDGDVRIFCIPKAQAEVLDTWHVAGLQGTGSHDFAIDGLLVPAARTMRALGEPVRRGGPLFRQPVKLFVGNELGPVAVGIARRALDDMRAAATPARGERAAFRKSLGQADARIRAARLLYLDTVALGWERFERGRADDALVDLCMSRWTYAVELCLEAVDGLFRYAGARALSLDDPMQRHLRNLLAARQHLFVSEENFEVAGGALLAGD